MGDPISVAVVVDGIAIRDGLTDEARVALQAIASVGGRHRFVRADQVIARLVADTNRTVDDATYAQLLALARSDVTRHVLVTGRGNLGSASDPPADPEYVDVMLSELGAAVVDLAEEARSAAPIPGVMLNGTRPFGGTFPAHHITRVVSAALAVLADPHIDDAVVGAMLGPPDFAARGVIVGGFDTLGSDQPRVTMRADVEVRRNRGNRLSVILSNVPPTIDEFDVLRQVGDLVRDIPDLRVPEGATVLNAGGQWVMWGSTVKVSQNQGYGRGSFVVDTTGGDPGEIEAVLRQGLPLEVDIDCSVDLPEVTSRGALVKRWVNDAVDVIVEGVLRQSADLQQRAATLEAALMVLDHPEVVSLLTENAGQSRDAAVASLTGPPVQLTHDQALAVASLHPATLQRPTAADDFRRELTDLDAARRYVSRIASRGDAAKALLAAHLETLPTTLADKRSTQIRPTADA